MAARSSGGEWGPCRLRATRVPGSRSLPPGCPPVKAGWGGGCPLYGWKRYTAG